MLTTEPERLTPKGKSNSTAKVPERLSKPQNRPNHLRRVLLFTGMTVLAVPFVFPVYLMAITALKRETEIFASPRLWTLDPQWANFVTPFTTTPFLAQFWNSTYIAIVTTVGILVIASLAGYSFARIRFHGRNLLFIILLSGMLVPAEVTIVPLYSLIDRFGWTNSHLALIVPGMLGVPMILGIFIIRQFFLAFPVELEEAARLDGLSRTGIFARIALPLAKAPLSALAVLSFLSSWNEFLEPLVFLRDRELWTLPLVLQSFVEPASGVPIWNLQMAAMTMAVVPVLVVYFFAQKQFVQGLASTGSK